MQRECPLSDQSNSACVRREGLTAPGLVVLATAAGLSVANVYLAQPMLDLIARDLDVPVAGLGRVVAATQGGYALGLVLLVPLGDMVGRRALIILQCLASVAALIAVASATSAIMLLVAMAFMGFVAVVAQQLVAAAAHLATPASRGTAVGAVTSGIVVGILAARFVAGIVADAGGWRAAYAGSATLMLLISFFTASILRRDAVPVRQRSYGKLLRAIPALYLKDPALRIRGMIALLFFGAFSSLWTPLVLPLSAPPYDYTHSQVGMVGLVGLAGVLAASRAGKLADRGLGERVSTGALVLLVLSWIPIALLPHSLPLLLFGILLLDLAVQAVHVSNQSAIVARYPDAGSSLIAGYMIFYSIGSAAGALLATAAYARWGWAGSSAVGMAFSTAALLTWCAYRSRGAPTARGSDRTP